MLINCSVGISTKQNNTITWVQFDPNMLISETFKYTISSTELTIHNITAEDGKEYACYSKEMAILYRVINVIVTCTLSILGCLVYCVHIYIQIKNTLGVKGGRPAV